MRRSHHLLPWRPLLVRVLLVGLLSTLGTSTAVAHGGEETDQAGEAIRQAIAYMVNDPSNMDMISDKIADSLEAKDTSGVNLAMVRRAQSAVEANHMMRARTLLEMAIGARSDMAGTDMLPILQVPRGGSTITLAVGSETGTSVVTDSLPGRGPLTGADKLLLAMAGLLGLSGVLLSLRLRPPDSIRALRRQAKLAGRA